MEHSEYSLALYRLMYLVPSVVIVLAAAGARWSVRNRRPEWLWASWIGAWLLLALGASVLSSSYLTLLPGVAFNMVASGGAVLAAMLIIPWRELPDHRSGWTERAARFGRGAFGVVVATLLLPILHEFLLIVFDMP